MNRPVALRAQGNEIALRIIAQLASVLKVMDLQSRDGAAELASPTIPFKDVPVECGVCRRDQPNAPKLRQE